MESKGDEKMKKNITMNIATQIYSIWSAWITFL